MKYALPDTHTPRVVSPHMAPLFFSMKWNLICVRNKPSPPFTSPQTQLRAAWAHREHRAKHLLDIEIAKTNKPTNKFPKKTSCKNMVAKVSPVWEKMALRFPSTPNSCWTGSSEPRINLHRVEKRFSNTQIHLKRCTETNPTLLSPYGKRCAHWRWSEKPLKTVNPREKSWRPLRSSPLRQ